MDDARDAVPDEFTEQVRDALLQVYDPGGLRNHLLLTLAGGRMADPATRGQWLRQALLRAIEAVRPGPGVATTARAWRTYRLLELRYVEGYDIADVVEQVALSKSQYHRENHRALQAVAAVLWEQWRLADRWSGATPLVAADASAQREAERLAPAAGYPGALDPMEALLGVRDLVQPLCARRGIELRLQLAERPAPALGERVALRQALLAILTQLIRALADTIVTITLVGHDERVDIRMHGAAPGPDAAARQGIEASQPFVEALRARVGYQPATGGRWTICLSLPASSRSTVLVVDNNAAFIRLVERYVAGQAWEVVGATEIEEAQRQARQRQPRAILLDVVIPGRDGWELLLALKTDPSTRALPVIICSVLDEPEVAIALGAVAYLHKPISRDQLLRALTPFQR